MAKIRLRLGSCEVEIDSGDFHVDNDTAPSVIDRIARSMQGAAAPRAQVLAASEAADAAAAGTADAGCGGSSGADGRAARTAGGSRPLPSPAAAASTAAAAPILTVAAGAAGAARPPAADGLSSVLDGLDEAEVFEPEFDEPRRVAAAEVAQRLRAMAAGGFFGERRTVSEAVDGMAERGWLAGPLDVSKALARMAMGREMQRETRGHMTYYFAPEAAEPPSFSAAAPCAPVPS